MTPTEAYRFACMALMVCRFAYYVRSSEVVSDATYDDAMAACAKYDEVFADKHCPDVTKPDHMRAALIAGLAAGRLRP